LSRHIKQNYLAKPERKGERNARGDSWSDYGVYCQEREKLDGWALKEKWSPQTCILSLSQFSLA
jgi:hypothetical protein